jgi:hypothetical protein
MAQPRRSFIAALTVASLGAALLPALAALPAAADEADDPKKRARLNRAAADAFAALMPAAPEDWRGGKTATDWRRDGGQARRRYRHKDGNEIAVSFEVRTRGIAYKKDLYDDPSKAAARGYKIVQFGTQKVLLRDSPVRREARVWLDGRILVLMAGKGEVSDFEMLVKAIDFEKLKKVK